MKESHIDGLIPRWGDIRTTWKEMCVWKESRQGDTHTDTGSEMEGWREGVGESA